MRLGISSHAFAWAIGVPGFPVPPQPLTARGLVACAAELQVRVVQLADNVPPEQMCRDELDTLITSAAASRIDLEIGTAGILPERLLQFLELAVQMRSPIVRTLLDSPRLAPTPDQAVELLREVLPSFERAGICLAIENHDRHSAAELAHIIGSLDSPAAGICLDTANSLGCGEGLETVIRRLAPWVVNVHVKDFRAERLAHKKGFLIQGCPAGQGLLDMASILTELRRHGRNPNVILESWVPPEPTVTGTVAKEAEWARVSIEYLRQWIPE
jgi:sugar phosphate isomerase/epimerase